ncbi:MAG: fused MFS/spermidine synthase, partial [Pirellulaceae bacterium]
QSENEVSLGVAGWGRTPRVSLAYALFFASGMAGLIYEIVWMRSLTTVFGAGIYAMSAVVAAFMAGLALGAAAFGKFSDRLSRPFLVYAVLELLIAGAGLLMPFLLARLGVIDAWVYRLGGQNVALLTACRFAVTFVLLLVPTTLMGGTLPILSRAIVREGKHLGRHVGGLYAINTLGAVLGAFLSGFWLISNWGLFGTSMAAVLLNVVAGLGAMFLLGNIESVCSPGHASSFPLPAPAPSVAAAESSLTGTAFRTVLLAAFVTGAVSLAAQLLWTRSLVFHFDELKNTTYCFSATLTVFLSGLAIGGGASGVIADRLRTPLFGYALTLCLLGIAIAGSANVLQLELPGFHAIDVATDSLHMPRAVLSVMYKTVLVLGVPTLLMGMAFPLAVRAAVAIPHVGRHVGWLYALNTAGAVAGSLLAGFVVVPFAGLIGGLFVLATVDVAVGIALVAQTDRSRGVRIALAVLVVGTLFASWGMAPQRRTLQKLEVGESLISYQESPVATVSVIESEWGERRLSIDDVAVAGTSSMMQTDQKSLAHVGTLLARTPRAAMTVGFGSGGASYSFLLHDQLQRVDCVEICPAVVRTAPYMTAANHGFLDRDDTRYRLIFDDAAAYLRYTTHSYDIISSDCTDLKYKSSASLYDLEYFRSCRDKLNPGGVIVAWMPLGGLSDVTFRVALRTFHRVFPEMAVFYLHNEWTHFVLLVGWRDEMIIDFDRLAQRMKEPDVRADLAAIGFQDPYKLLAAFVTSGRALERFLAGNTLNTRNWPVIEFEAPKHGYVHRIAQANLMKLMQHRVSVRPWVESQQIDWQRLGRYESAVPHILEGHLHAKNMDVESATIAFLRARAITPEDEQLRKALEFPWLARLAEQGNPTAWLLLGRSQQLQGNHARALQLFRLYEQGLADFASGRRTATPETLYQTSAWSKTARIWREDSERALGQQE